MGEGTCQALVVLTTGKGVETWPEEVRPWDLKDPVLTEKLHSLQNDGVKTPSNQLVPPGQDIES